jgi:hypothetical protein
MCSLSRSVSIYTLSLGLALVASYPVFAQQDMSLSDLLSQQDLSGLLSQSDVASLLAQSDLSSLLGQTSTFVAPTSGFFDPTGPEPVFLDRPMTRWEERLFFQGRLRVPRNRPFTFDASGGLFGWEADQTPLTNPYQSRQVWNSGRNPAAFGQWYAPRGFGFGAPSTAPGTYYAPGRGPGAFGTFRGPMPTQAPKR